MCVHPFYSLSVSRNKYGFHIGTLLHRFRGFHEKTTPVKSQSGKKKTIRLESQSLSATLPTLTILSSPSTSMSLTPCVFLPCREMFPARVLISFPDLVIITTSSSSLTCIRPTAFPPFSMVFIEITPLPPRF